MCLAKPVVPFALLFTVFFLAQEEVGGGTSVEGGAIEWVKRLGGKIVRDMSFAVSNRAIFAV
jgi:hypothetical protein